MEDKNLEEQVKAEKEAYQIAIEEPKNLVETFDNKSITTIEKPSKKRKWIPIGIGIIITIFFLLLGFLYLKIYPKYMLVKSLDTWTGGFDVLKEPMNHFKDYEFDEMTTKGTAKIEISDFLLSNLGEENNETLDILKKLNSLSLEVESRISKKDQKALIALSGKIGEESIFNIGYRNDNQKQYILLKDVLETYLELEDTNNLVDENPDIEYYEENLEHVWSILKKSFKKNLKSSYIKKSNEQIEVDGKKVYTTKISFTIDENVHKELTKNIIEDLKKDKKANDFLVKLYPEFANYEETKMNDLNRLCYSVNVTKILPKIVKVSLVTEEGSGISLIKGKNQVFEFLETEKPLFRMIMREEKDGFKMKLEVEENNLEMLLTGKKDKNSMVYHLTTEANGTSLETILTLTTKEKKKDILKKNAELEFSVKAGGLELSILKLNLDLETIRGAEFDEMKDSKLATELTEEEQEKIRVYFEDIGKLFEK